MMGLKSIADSLKISVNHLSTDTMVAWHRKSLLEAGSLMEIDWFIDGAAEPWQECMIMKSSMLIRIERMREVRAIGAARGYLLPDDPIPRIEAINRQRSSLSELDVSREEAADLAEACVELSKLARAYDEGRIKFDRNLPAAQIASYEVSVDGMSPQTGDGLAEILGYQPDADFIKRKRAIEALAKLDFSKRKPYLLFTADAITEGRRADGTIVCWGRMRDASGYQVMKRDVFAMEDHPPARFSNEELIQTTAALKLDNRFMQLVSFYDWLGADDFFAFVDRSGRSNTLYAYEITGYQNRIPASPFIFDVPMNSLYLTPTQTAEIRKIIASEGSGVSPYPALSKVIYGDPGYSWILAGCNIQGSRKRGDQADAVRRLGYIGSDAEHILAEALAGRLFVPASIGEVQHTVELAISSFGVSQTLLSILDGVGMTMFISGKDDPEGFQPSEEALQRTGTGLAKIIAAIDPASATVDPAVLAGILMDRTAKGGMQGALGESRGRSLKSQTILNPIPLEQGSDANPADIISGPIIDLTTYVGMGRFMNVIRAVYDFCPGALT